jgi:hypothetical protein
MSEVTLRRTSARIGPLQIAIIVLAAATGVIHLIRGIMTSVAPRIPRGNFPRGGFRPGHLPGPPPGGLSLGFSIMRYLPLPLSTLFFLNFAGYIVLAAVLYMPFLSQYQRVIRWLLIGYVLLTIIMWFLITGAQPNLLAYIDKPIEVALIVLLLIDGRRASISRREQVNLNRA